MKTRVFHLDGKNINYVASEVATSLLNGGVCIIPTDTIYGIVALDDRLEAVKRIYEIKKRPLSKKLIRLIGKLELIKRYTDQEVPDRLKRYWPGPLTIVFRGKNGESIALRYPDNEFLNALFMHLGDRAIVAPSANITGRDEIRSCKDLIDEFDGIVDVIVCTDRPPALKASTIIDITDDENWKILRQGDLTVDL